MSLLTTQPDQDRVALAAAERLGRSLSARVRLPLPSGIELRVYPDLDTFRNITGEPGWVAAHTEGRRIHLQPVALLHSHDALESALSHELLHVMVESQAARDLPVWFREGLVEFLSGQRIAADVRIPGDADLRQTTDAAAARRAYASAAAMVSSLVRTYGETTVLDWVKRGLPAASAESKACTAAAAAPRSNRSIGEPALRSHGSRSNHSPPLPTASEAAALAKPPIALSTARR